MNMKAVLSVLFLFVIPPRGEKIVILKKGKHEGNAGPETSQKFLER